MRQRHLKRKAVCFLLLLFLACLNTAAIHSMEEIAELRPKLDGGELPSSFREMRFGLEKEPKDYLGETSGMTERWLKGRKEYQELDGMYRAIQESFQGFPVALAADAKEAGEKQGEAGIDKENREDAVNFENGFLDARNFGGNRKHEGTDIMSVSGERGELPVVSVSDGVVEKKGWLRLGGYRVGIRSDQGIYYYYAHLDHYARIEEGDRVKTGDLLGYMGDTGYGEEGTKGKFPVHLHFGIYVTYKGQEISVNPYWILKEFRKGKR